MASAASSGGAGAIADEVVVRLAGGLVETRWSARELEILEPARAVAGIERRLGRLEDERSDAALSLQQVEKEAERARAGLDRRFEHVDSLAIARRRQAEIQSILTPETEVSVPPTQPSREETALART